jgi:hypothetical protein
MYLEPIVVDIVTIGLLADFDDGNEMPVEHFRNLFRDEASIRKMKEPLNGHDLLRLDPIMSDMLFELAWFHDSSRTEEVPCWDRQTIEKMRKPVVGFRHYRVTPTCLHLLSDLAWFHDGLLDGE